MDKDEMIYKLWKLLDDIDTLDDAAKDNDLAFRKGCYKVQRKRFDIVPQEYIDNLHDKYYP